MSKIGRRPIATDGVQVEVKNGVVHYKGPKSFGEHVLPESLEVKLDGKTLALYPAPAFARERSINQVWGLHRSLLDSKIKGASHGFERRLQINGLGFKAQVSGKNVVFALGFSHKIDFELPDTVTMEVDKTGQHITLKSPNKELVGQVASTMRALRPPEPYKGTGVKYVEEVILRKAGKAKAAA
jgi:large subunit ribosomal protein L6